MTGTGGKWILIRSAGKATRGYDPSKDIEWLRFEIVRWIQGNLMEKWYKHWLGSSQGHWLMERL